jgi:hypothetical protein
MVGDRSSENALLAAGANYSVNPSPRVFHLEFFFVNFAAVANQ